MSNLTFNITLSGNPGKITQTQTFVGDNTQQLNFTVPIQSDYLVAFTLDVSLLKSIMIRSNQIVTLNTNNAGGDTTLILPANDPFVWWSTSTFANPFGVTDVTSLHFDNTSAAIATVDMLLNMDSTPTA